MTFLKLPETQPLFLCSMVQLLFQGHLMVKNGCQSSSQHSYIATSRNKERVEEHALFFKGYCPEWHTQTLHCIVHNLLT